MSQKYVQLIIHATIHVPYAVEVEVEGLGEEVELVEVVVEVVTKTDVITHPM
jgi:hypothetical protein